MDKIKLIDIIFAQWSARFNSSDKKTKSARANFEELFQTWKDLGASFDDLYETYLPKAIKVHQPLSSTAKAVYKKNKASTTKTEKEFIDEWNGSIEATGQDVFFEFFPAVPLDKDDEPKVFGNMSATEYRAQRRYADQFPTLDTTELVKAWREQKQYNPDVDDKLENILGGGSDETNS
jgi:hypothetical protein